MRASFVAHLYSIEETPRPVVWGKGPKTPQVSDADADVVSPGHVSVVQQQPWVDHEHTHADVSHNAGYSWTVPLPPGRVSASSSSSGMPCDASVGRSINASGLVMPAPDTFRSGCLSHDARSGDRIARRVPGSDTHVHEGTIPLDLHESTSRSEVCHASREYGPLPKMPVMYAGNDSRSRPSDDPACPSGASGEGEPNRQDRLLQITSHGYAMADDEMFFQLQHLLACQAQPVQREFLLIPPLHVIKWLGGDDLDFRAWIDQHCGELQDGQHHVIVVLLLEMHWIPVWFAPAPGGMHAHTLSDFASDEARVDQVLFHIVHKLGSSLQLIHRVPHGIEIQKLCGVMSISFLAHIILGTRLPQTIEDLYSRCWSMKEAFADAIATGPFSMPTAWGWGDPGESRLLPIMPEWSPFVAAFRTIVGCHPMMIETFEQGQHGSQGDSGMTLAEMTYHFESLRNACPDGVVCHEPVCTSDQLIACVRDFLLGPPFAMCCALLLEEHWTPVLAWKQASGITVIAEAGVGAALLQTHFPGMQLIQVEPNVRPFCGVATWVTCALLWTNRFIVVDLQTIRIALQDRTPCTIVLDGSPIGFGPQGPLLKSLCTELLKHGVPDDVVEERARAAIKALGSEQISTALNHRQPWRQLKFLGNHSKFHFVLPSELSAVVEANKGKPVTNKGKGKGKSKQAPQPVDLDPCKLQVLEGTFRFQDRVLSQLSPKQIGPVSSGFILMSLQDAEPYLKAGSMVSKEPLALVVLHSVGTRISTELPHAQITVPCRCTIDSEPVLAEAVIVQVGQGTVEKVSGSALLEVDSPDVVTLKVLIYRDEFKGDWEEFCLSPIKCLVAILPMLKRCLTPDCHCPGWHNHEQLPIRDPILDVWRRQFLRQGFKPCPASQAEFFSVCLRIPHCLLDVLLAASGNSGAYCEPRSADGKEVLTEYTVVWTPKHSLQEMQHLMQTNPAVMGLARLGDRRGLRVRTLQAKAIHQLVRPDAVYLPSGPKCQYTVGPFPYGADRQAVGKILLAAGWECRPLQPTAPCPGRGAMWLVQSAEDPSQTIIPTTSGEIMIAKIKQEALSPSVSPTTVGTAATLALCGKTIEGKRTEPDPWALSDPWR